MSNALSFTKLFKLESDSKLSVDPDEQICVMVSMLKGTLRNWQIIAPSKNKRVIYFELDDNDKLEFVKGSFEQMRNMMKKT